MARRTASLAFVVSLVGSMHGGRALALSPEPRWPSWPTEIDRIAAPLGDRSDRLTGERDRAAAITRLERYATPVIERAIVAALDDPSISVRREALNVCYRREMSACIAKAAAIWGKGLEPSLRRAALWVLSLELDAPRRVILISALRDASEEMRAEAAQILGTATIDPSDRKEVRAALLAKLSDPVANVRRYAVESVGLLGENDGDGTLAITRLLDDPEPAVRAAAARTLRWIRDHRAVPAMIRALGSQNEAPVTRALLEALATLPGDGVPEALLSALDAPPGGGVSPYHVADAIGLRPSPEPTLVDGLIQRLGEPRLAPASTRALLLLGEATRDALLVVRTRGLDPALQAEVDRLLAALDPAPKIHREPDPLPSRFEAGLALERGSTLDRFERAVALGAAHPDWLDAAIAEALEGAQPIAVLRPWLVAMATAERGLVLGPRFLPWARLLGWAHDEGLSPSDRCLALVALGSATERTAVHRIHHELVRFANDVRDPALRACTSWAAARTSDGASTLVEALLLDPDARVRTSAVLALARTRPTPSAVARRESMATDDESPEARAAARWSRDPAHASVRHGIVVSPRPDFAWSRPPRFVELTDGQGTRLWLPLSSHAEVGWSFGPLLVPR